MQGKKLNHQWPVETNPTEFMINQLGELSSVSVWLASRFFIKLLDARWVSGNEFEKEFIDEAKVLISELAKREHAMRALDEANKFGLSFKYETSKLILEYANLRDKVKLNDGNQALMLDALHDRLVDYLMNSEFVSTPHTPDLKLASQLVTEFLIKVETDEESIPQSPLIIPYLHHPLIDKAAASTITIYFLHWAKTSSILQIVEHG